MLTHHIQKKHKMFHLKVNFDVLDYMWHYKILNYHIHLNYLESQERYCYSL